MKPNMTYYIDPNEGSNGDAIGVTCRKFETIEGWFTCLSPEKSQIDFESMSECKSSGLMSCKNGKPFSYGNKGIAKYQLKSLATRSQMAFQAVTYDCKNGRSASGMTGWNGMEFSTDSPSTGVIYDVEVDSRCKDGMSDTYTVFTRAPEMLPFADMEAKLGQNGASITLGEVCFG